MYSSELKDVLVENESQCSALHTVVTLVPTRNLACVVQVGGERASPMAYHGRLLEK